MANQPGFAALADDTRRTIFERAARRPSSVGKLAEGLDVTRPAVSQHLKVLLRAGLVVQRGEGSRCIYQVDRAACRRRATTSTGSGTAPSPPSSSQPNRRTRDQRQEAHRGRDLAAARL